MWSGPTYYDFFGVSPTASAEQIRSAYLWLMKQHHPDLTGQADKQRSASFAAVVNLSYAVLRDPDQRARYDAYIARESHQTATHPSRRRRPLLTAQSHRSRRRRWDPSSIGTTILACAIAAAAAGALFVPPTAIGHLSSGALPAHARQVPVSWSTAGSRAGEIRDKARLAMSLTAEEAEIASRHCFLSARAGSNIAETEICIVFDDAYVDWNQRADVIPRPSYFDNSALPLRHQNALAAMGQPPERRLDELKQLALNALLAEIRAQIGAQTLPQATGNELADSEDAVSQ